MAFTGSATVIKVSDRKFKITGLSLAGDASGTIGFSDKTVAAGVSITAPEWQPYKNSENQLVSLINAVEARMTLVTDVTAAVPVSVVATGVDHANFVLTFHNDSAATVSALFDIYLEFGG